MMNEQQQIDHFIGRAEEIKVFTNWLTDPDAPWILYIHDAAEEADKKGGVGKTWLLRRYADIVRNSNQDAAIVMADFFNVGDRDRVFLAEKIVTGIQELYPAWTPTTFLDVIQQHRAQESQEALTSRGTESSEIRIREVVSAALAEDLRQLDTYLAQEKKTLVAFFDTFEAIEQNTGIAVLRQSQTFPDNYQFENMRIVIAGRNKLDWTHPNWRGREQEVRVMALRPFSAQEMLEYVEAESIYGLPTQNNLVNALYERTEGRPIIIGLTIDVLNYRILTLQNLVTAPKSEFERYLIPQVNNLENPLNWVILFMAHVYHHFNMSILDWILHNVTLDQPIHSINPEELARKLPQLSFVRQSGQDNDFVLHDEMRRLVVKYCWDVQDTDKRYRRDISRGIINYCEQELTRVQNDQQRQRYIIEILYHRLFVDPDDGVQYFKSQHRNALNLSKHAFTRLLLQEFQIFRSSLSLAQYNELQFSEAMLLRTEENPVDALRLLQEIRRELDPHWYEQNQSGLLLEEGRCYRQQGKYVEANDYFIQALEIEQRQGNEQQSARLLTVLGRIARRRGQFSIALNYYEQSITIYKKLGRRSDYADTLIDIGTVYRNQGKIDEALRMCKVAGRILLDLFQEGNVSEILIGLNLVSLGQIYLDAGNTAEAERNFREAFDIYLRANYKAGIAVIYNLFGHVQLRTNDLENAREWFVKAQAASRAIDIEQYINSLNKQGRIYTLQSQWEEAKAFFEQAIDAAKSASDYYQQTESLIDFANVAEHVKQTGLVNQFLQEAEEIAKRENYLLLLGQIEHIRGETNFRTEEYPGAFQHFALYCHYMAQYNLAEFNSAVQKVIDALLEMPKEIVPEIVEQLLVYWSNHQLDKSYPELMKIKEVEDTLMML